MLAAVGLINGRVQAYRVTPSDDPTLSTAAEVVSKKAHKESCRAVRFTADGAALLTASADRYTLLTACTSVLLQFKRSSGHTLTRFDGRCSVERTYQDSQAHLSGMHMALLLCCQ